MVISYQAGQKHRLQLAICLAKQKDIILLDDLQQGLI